TDEVDRNKAVSDSKYNNLSNALQGVEGVLDQHGLKLDDLLNYKNESKGRIDGQNIRLGHVEGGVNSLTDEVDRNKDVIESKFSARIDGLSYTQKEQHKTAQETAERAIRKAGYAMQHAGKAINEAEQRNRDLIALNTGASIVSNEAEHQERISEDTKITGKIDAFINQVNNPDFENKKNINSALTYIEKIKSDDSILVGKPGKKRVANAVLDEINKIADLYGLETTISAKNISSDDFKNQLTYLEKALLEKKENLSGSP
ncbi:MAG: hypothetical protein KAT91_00505, partial [Candidatus Aenigmarchaeota archaeon]|nr:hypothetical protein [Candidatus Aenigmarchaeota archaeon]